MNRVPVIVWNPAYIEELEPRDSMDLISGGSQIITAPASDDGATVEELLMSRMLEVVQRKLRWM